MAVVAGDAGLLHAHRHREPDHGFAASALFDPPEVVGCIRVLLPPAQSEMLEGFALEGIEGRALAVQKRGV